MVRSNLHFKRACRTMQPFSAATFLSFMAITGANAASFDCAIASSRIENAICASPKVSKLDSKVEMLAQVTAQVGKPLVPVGPSVDQASAPVPSQARVPKNPSGWSHCTREDLSPAQFEICENPSNARQFKELDDSLGRSLLRLQKLKASVKRAETDKVVAAAAVLWSKPEVACLKLDMDCILQATQEAARKADEAAIAAEGRMLPLQAASDKRYFQQRDAMPLVITNGGGGNKRRSSGEYITNLTVENRTDNAFSEIAVSCGLFETWGDEKSVEPEFSHTIRAGIAPKSRTLSLGYIDVPWDLGKWGTDAQVIKCRVVSTKAASAAEAKASIEKNQAETALIQQRSQAAIKGWDEERDRTRRDQSADQLMRLNNAIASLTPTVSCNAYGQAMARLRGTVIEWQKAGQSPYSIVQGHINEAKRMGCL